MVHFLLYGFFYNQFNNQYNLSLSGKEYFTKEILNVFDNVVAGDNLYYLPDACGASVKTLPMKLVDSELSIKNNSILINNISPAESDLIYIEFETRSKSPVIFFMELNNLPKFLHFTSAKKKVLIPLDNYPSWLLEKNLYKLSLFSSSEFKITKVSLYKRL